MKNIKHRLTIIKSYKRPVNQTGFTLIELMIVIAIIGIISAIAFPSYNSYLRKSRRADAKVTLTKMASTQERWYLQKSTYTSDVDNIGGDTSDDGHYTMAITSADSDGYEMTATIIDGGAQSNDTSCQTFTLASTGLKTATSPTCW